MTTHNQSRTRLYKVWSAMKDRCSNPNNPKYPRYGNRGITVCDSWLKASNFLSWASDKYKPGLTLDRIDNNKGYSPNNCRFISNRFNSMNTCRSNTYPGVSPNPRSGKYYTYINLKKGKKIQLFKSSSRELCLIAYLFTAEFLDFSLL